MLAGAVAAAQLATDLGPPAVTWTLVLLLASLATGIAATSYHRWRQHELAMRLGRPLPSPVLLPVLAAGVTLLCLLVLAGLLLSR